MSASNQDRTHLAIPTPIYRRLKAVAALEGRTIPDLAGTLLDASLADLLARAVENLPAPSPDQLDLLDAIDSAK
ncbi:MAG: hypothetical protein VYE40_07925 [Myxococcota bacterium]|nr:hypothetical protein [Myxococcota bacterium]